MAMFFLKIPLLDSPALFFFGRQVAKIRQNKKTLVMRCFQMQGTLTFVQYCPCNLVQCSVHIGKEHEELGEDFIGK